MWDNQAASTYPAKTQTQTKSWALIEAPLGSSNITKTHLVVYVDLAHLGRHSLPLLLLRLGYEPTRSGDKSGCVGAAGRVRGWGRVGGGRGGEVGGKGGSAKMPPGSHVRSADWSIANGIEPYVSHRLYPPTTQATLAQNLLRTGTGTGGRPRSLLRVAQAR